MLAGQKKNASDAARRLPNRKAALDALYGDISRQEHVSVLGDLDRRRA